MVMPDGAVRAAIKDATTPLDIANELSKSLGKKVLVAKVDGELWDVFRPLEGATLAGSHPSASAASSGLESKRLRSGVAMTPAQAGHPCSCRVAMTARQW